MSQNSKNPTALMLMRLERAKEGQEGILVRGLKNFFKANFGATTLPKVAADAILYDQLRTVGATNLSFFNGAFTPQRSNFPGGSFQLPQSEHMLILGLKIYDGAAATVEQTNWQPGVSDALVKNGNIDVLVNGQKVITAVPMTAFDTNATSATTAGRTDENRGFYYLTEPIALLGQTTLNINLALLTATATANYNLRVELHGIRFIGS